MNELETPDLRADTKDGKEIKRDMVKLVDSLNGIIRDLYFRIEKLEDEKRRKNEWQQDIS